MTKSVDKLIAEYYDRVKHKYDLDLDNFSDICKAPFIFFRKMIEQPTLPIIKIKYFGKFLIYSNSAKRMIKNLEVMKDNNQIDEETFINSIANLKRHIYEGKDSNDMETGEATN